MRLYDFIPAHREAILKEWEAFARTCAPASRTMDVTALRDHASEMLTVIAADLRTYQGGAAQTEKSLGRARSSSSDPDTAAESHGAGRAASGFTVVQMVAEYRALRASVLRLWGQEQSALTVEEIEDMNRFNEAIDQSLAESVLEFEDNVATAKEMFLAMLGHDLRSPLAAISTSAQFMLGTNELEEPHRTLTARIITSAKRTLQLVGDLLDFTRSRLGGGIPVVRENVDVGKLVRDVVEEITAANPDALVRADTRGAQRAALDGARISQVLTNLLTNAVEHGTRGTAITVAVGGTEEEVAISVHNRGRVITPEQQDGLFNPFKGGRPGPTANLGLGLYIAERIVAAHGGRIEVTSSEEAGTTFTLRLPRH